VAHHGLQQVGQAVAHLARKLAGEAPVDQAEPAARGDEDVSRVRVGVEEADADDLVEDAVAAVARDGGRLLGHQPGTRGRDALDEFRHQQAPACEARQHARGEDMLRVWVAGVEQLRVCGFGFEVSSGRNLRSTSNTSGRCRAQGRHAVQDARYPSAVSRVGSVNRARCRDAGS
jgi:hypothetical protein